MSSTLRQALNAAKSPSHVEDLTEALHLWYLGQRRPLNLMMMYATETYRHASSGRESQKRIAEEYSKYVYSIAMERKREMVTEGSMEMDAQLDAMFETLQSDDFDIKAAFERRRIAMAGASDARDVQAFAESLKAFLCALIASMSDDNNDDK